MPAASTMLCTSPPTICFEVKGGIGSKPDLTSSEKACLRYISIMDVHSEHGIDNLFFKLKCAFHQTGL